MKEYDLMWISPDFDERCPHKRRVVTDKPKDALFNFACQMIVMANTFFGQLDIDNIRKNIKTGSTDKIHRERYWIEFPSGEILSCQEVITTTTNN